MPNQPYYGDPYNQGDFNYTTKFGKKKPKTEGEKIDTGTYTEEGPIDTGDLGPDGKPLMSATNPLEDLTINPNRKTLTESEKRLQDKLRRRAGTGQQGADLAREKLEKKGGSATDLPTFLQVHKEADPIIQQGITEDIAENAARDKAIQDVIKSTEPKSQERLQGLKDIAQQLGEDSLGYGLMALQKYGEVIDWTNDQVNLRNNLPSLLRGVETPIDALLDYSYKDLRDDIAGGIGNVVGATTGSETANTVAEIGAQILLPDAMDFRTGGLGYLDNIGRAALKLRKADGKFINDAVNFADNLVFQIRQKLGGEGNLELAGIGMRINKNNATDTFYQAKGVSKGSGGGSTSFVKRPNFGSAEEALTAGYGGKSFERLMKSKRHLKLYGDSAEEAAAFMQRGWNHFAVNKTLRGMEGGRYITLSNGQVLKLKTNTAASKINAEKMTGLSLKNDLAQEAYRLKRNLGTQFDIPKLQAFADKSGYPPQAVTAYIKAAKEHNKKIDELVKYLNKKGGSVMWSKGHYRAVENLIQMGTGDKASANMITNVFLQKLSPNAKMQAKNDLPHLLNLASNRAASVEEDFLKFVEPELFGSFWPKLTGKYKTVFIDRVLEDMQKASGKGIDIRDIIEENVNLILEDTNLIETIGRIKFDANKVYPWLQKHGVNIKANFNVK